MPKFNEMGEYQRDFRNAEIEEYNLKNAKWNTTISVFFSGFHNCPIGVIF